MNHLMRNRNALPILAVFLLSALLITSPATATAAANFGTVNVDDVISPGEWDFAEVEFDTGPRPCEPPNPGGWDLSGAKGRFAWDAVNVYGLVEAYPNTCGLGANPNGPFDNMNWEVYINALGWPAAVFLDSTSPDNNHPGSTVVFSLDRMVIEFSVPVATIVDDTGGNLPTPYTFNPSAGDFLEWRMTITDPDSAGGFDSRDQTLGWVIEPRETGGGYRRLDFTPPPVVTATANIDPDVLNLKSRGRWITVYITLPEGYNVDDIVPATIKLNGILAAWSEIQDGVYMVKFDRAAVQNYVTHPSAPKFYELTLTVTGELSDGTVFQGSDTIVVIMK